MKKFTNTPSLQFLNAYDEDVTSAHLSGIQEGERRGFDKGMEHREFLICPCGCAMRIDDDRYEEEHRGETFSPVEMMQETQDRHDKAFRIKHQ